jgi:antitoxin MazE
MGYTPINQETDMVTKVQKWGNSQGLRLSKQILDDARISVGESVQVVVEDDQIVIRRAARSQFDIRELVSRMPRNYKAREASFGPPVGQEAW